MTEREAVVRIFEGMRADIASYRTLRELLAAQFNAAVQHRAGVMQEIAERLAQIATELEARRRERVELASRLCKDRPSIRAVAARLQGSSREAFEACWKALEALVEECRELNQRNWHVVVTQHEIMQRVLHGETHTYEAVHAAR